MIHEYIKVLKEYLNNEDFEFCKSKLNPNKDNFNNLPREAEPTIILNMGIEWTTLTETDFIKLKDIYKSLVPEYKEEIFDIQELKKQAKNILKFINYYEKNA